MCDILKPGDYVIIKRQGYTKLHKLKEHGTVTLGHFVIELDNCIGNKYFETFQMKLKTGEKKLYVLEKVKQVTDVLDLSREKSGRDNRHITDDGSSQNLSKEEITKLQEGSVSSTDIVEKLIENSRTFNSKTEYSQEKYLKKKEKKYFEYIQFQKPTIRLLAQMYYRQDPAKMLGLRIDDLSQILTYANVQSDGDYILYDSGTSGLITSAVLNSIGRDTRGKLIHMHPGNECQKNAFIAMQFPEEQQSRCINVNLYSVLRCFYQNKDSYNNTLDREENKVQIYPEDKDKAEVYPEDKDKAEIEDKVEEDNCEAQPSKKRKLEENKPSWQKENEKACKILQNKVDGLIIVSKEHPTNIVTALQPFLKASRNLVVFNLIREPLQDLYVHLKSKCNFVCIKLSNNFLRNYQILPERTHPEVNMNSGGYILTAYKLEF